MVAQPGLACDEMAAIPGPHSLGLERRSRQLLLNPDVPLGKAHRLQPADPRFCLPSLHLAEGPLRSGVTFRLVVNTLDEWPPSKANSSVRDDRSCTGLPSGCGSQSSSRWLCWSSSDWSWARAAHDRRTARGAPRRLGL